MKQTYFFRILYTCVCSCGFLYTTSEISLSQVTPDGTVNTQVNQNGNVSEIIGGETRGGNLFHSFQNFSISTGNEAFFKNADTISNIFFRVTGGNISNIDGLIRANGNANLFFVNPNGIIFGENASLNIGGSFVASTANKIDFADGTEFNTTNSSSSPILTVSIPIGLGFSSHSGSILVKGNGHNFAADDPSFSPIIRSRNFNGLAVNPGRSITLLGNDITFQGGNLLASQGKIQLGSISQGIVRFNYENLALNFQEVQDFGDIVLTSESSIDVSGSTGGLILARGSSIAINDGSVLLVQNQSSNSANGIFLQASNDINISGTSQTGLVRSYVLSEGFAGKTGNIQISSRNLRVEGGAAIAIRAFGTASSKDITLNIADSIQVSGFNQIIPDALSAISLVNLGNGRGGSIDISTERILADNGGGIGTITFGGLGNSGSLNIDADDINIVGVNPINTLASSLFSNTIGEGQGGEITIETSTLNILDGGQISTGTGASGNAGSVFIKADQLNIVSEPDIQLRVGDIRTSRIVAIAAPATPAQQELLGVAPVVRGASGNITIESKNINIERARITVSNQGQGAVGNIDLQTDSLTNTDGIISASGLSEFSDRSFAGGNINIDADFLNFDDGSINANTSFFGSGGNININTDIIHLDNNSSISVSSGFIGNNEQTATDNGGNITINTENLELVDRSQISASAGGLGNGGNVSIDADTIFGLNNSDITANAFEGNGGNIEISATAIVGLESRASLTELSDITADSELGIDGTVTINSPENTSDDDVVVSAKEVVINDAQKLIDGTCLARHRPRREEIVNVGGSIPESPYNFFDDEPIPLSTEKKENPAERSSNNIPERWQEGDPIIEGNTIFTTPDGRKFLVFRQPQNSQLPVCTK
jgi:filamentous hemagglutinin family protein